MNLDVKFTFLVGWCCKLISVFVLDCKRAFLSHIWMCECRETMSLLYISYSHYTYWREWPSGLGVWPYSPRSGFESRSLPLFISSYLGNVKLCVKARRTTSRPRKNGMWSRWCRAASRWIKPTVMECEVGGRRSKSRWIKPKGKLNSVFFSFFYLYATASVGLLRENFHFFKCFFHMNVKIFHKWKWKKMFF